MLTKTKSLLLSRILAVALTVIVLILTFFVPIIAEWYESFSMGEGLFGDADIELPMCITLYVCEALALFALHSLHVLLANINHGEVFIQRNTTCLRRISWACMLASCAFFIFGLWRFIFMFAAFFAVMFGLIMRVLKNVFESAVEMKSENDFTI